MNPSANRNGEKYAAGPPFRPAVFFTPIQFLLRNRLQRKPQTSEAVSIIAEESGIGNPFYFSRLFKEKYQNSPLEYCREFIGCSAGTNS